jgi:hypothetical protein
MEVLALLFFLWAWDGNLWEEVDPEPEEPVVEQSTPVPDNAVNVTEVTQTAAVLTAVGQALSGTSTATQTDAEIEAQIIEELENMDATTTSTSTTSSTGTSTSTSTSTGT